MSRTVCIKKGSPADNYVDSTILQLSKRLIINIDKLEEEDIIEKIYAKRLWNSHRLIGNKIYLKEGGLYIIGSLYYIKIEGKEV